MSQSNGKGQRGNTWQSEKGKNLLISIILKFDRGIGHSIQAYDQFAISEVAALSVTDLLSKYGIDAKIKWPNDIYVNDRKICGILIENSLKGEWISHSIIGVGLNINQETFDAQLKNPTSILKETGIEIDIRTCLDGLMNIFSGYCSRYLHINGGLSKLRKLYLAQMWRKDEFNRFLDVNEGRVFTGAIRGLDDIGNLMVEAEDSVIKVYGFKEIVYYGI